MLFSCDGRSLISIPLDYIEAMSLPMRVPCFHRHSCMHQHTSLESKYKAFNIPIMPDSCVREGQWHHAHYDVITELIYATIWCMPYHSNVLRLLTNTCDLTLAEASLNKNVTIHTQNYKYIPVYREQSSLISKLFIMLYRFWT